MISLGGVALVSYALLKPACLRSALFMERPDPSKMKAFALREFLKPTQSPLPSQMRKISLPADVDESMSSG